MERDSVHELSAAYALDALEEADAAAFELHLADCESCRRQLAELRAAAGQLGLASGGPPAPSGLRNRVLEAVREERGGRVLRFRSRRARRVTLAAAAAALLAIAALSAWVGVLSHSVARERARGVAIQTTGGTVVPLEGAAARVFVTPRREALLVVDRLPAAPPGKTYEAWVIVGRRALPAGTFRGGRRLVIPLLRPVPRGAVVAVTVERAGGVRRPTSPPVAHANV